MTCLDKLSYPWACYNIVLLPQNTIKNVKCSQTAIRHLRWLHWIFREYTSPLCTFTTSALTKILAKGYHSVVYIDENLL